MPTLAELTTGLARSLLSLPPRRCRVRLESSWIAMEDGVRLATRHLSPLHGQGAPAVLIRTPYGTRGGMSRDMLLGRLIAEAGYHVIVQDVRGRWDSEGSFAPFANEARDGAATLAWISQQPWCGDEIGLAGSSYCGHAAWAALSAAPERVRALVVVMGAADLHPAFHPGGAFSLQTALDWATLVGDRETTPRAHIDLERGLRHRPVREADRVALRRIDWFRDWVDHPRREDAYWEDLAAGMPDRPPPSLLIAGWYDFFLAAQLRDYANLAERAGAAQGAAPRLVVGPWSHGRAAHPSWRGLRHGFLGISLRETLSFLDLHLAGASAGEGLGLSTERSQEPAVRFFVGGGEEWRSSPEWPPPEAHSRSLYLRAAANAAEPHAGALSWEPPEEHEEPDCFEAKYEDPVPSVGGAFFSSQLWGRGAGAMDQRPLDGRSDVIRFTGEVLGAELEIAGRVALVLHAFSDAEDADFTAKLVDLAPDGSALNLCEGIVRCRRRAGGANSTDPEQSSSNMARALEIDLWACAWRFRRGHRIRLEVASASFPRFDRNPGSRDEAPGSGPRSPESTRYTVFHDRDRRSHLLLPVIDPEPVTSASPFTNASLGAADAKGPPG